MAPANYAGRCCRVGQLKLTHFYVLWVAGETHDQVAHDANKLHIKEVDALTCVAPTRLQRKWGRNESDEEANDESRARVSKEGLQNAMKQTYLEIAYLLSTDLLDQENPVIVHHTKPCHLMNLTARAMYC